MKEEVKLELLEMGQKVLNESLKDWTGNGREIVKKIIACNTEEELKAVIKSEADLALHLPKYLEWADDFVVNKLVDKADAEADKKLGADWFEVKVLPTFKFLRGVIV